ncbi:MAG: bifunctional UDP-N-acetylmuramoyl-tripeptide:D-alanyl-D-alanine ligase/alanine racemase [Bacteroidales bacterium]|nr:bifunctional UDP-N-acetylmuramoyl-tripeptide:D-alanyl-D-alanine ligase/alanine racemase [Bacteroidales bacterium]
MTQTKYTASKIAQITNGKLITSGEKDLVIRDLMIDSRHQVGDPEESMFIALVSPRNDGHKYIRELVNRGVRCFLVSSLPDEVQGSKFKVQGSRFNHQVSSTEQRAPSTEYRAPSTGQPTFILVPDTLAALQKLAAFHRREFDYPVVAVTGSNGKTIVKEWLYQILSPDFKVIRSPKSYNSQIGVPLSIWNMETQYNLAIIEAGISQPGEMEKLEEIIYPTIGIFTMIGPAHDELFSDDAEKVTEKLKLFRNVEILIYNSDYQIITNQLDHSPDFANLKTFTWGERDTDDLRIQRIVKEENQTTIRGSFQEKEIEITIPFIDNASIDNAIHCWALIQVQSSRFKTQEKRDEGRRSKVEDPVSSIKHPGSSIAYRFKNLTPVAMRLELKEAINSCSLINDSYNSDINSLSIALDFLMQQNQHKNKTLILSDILQTGRDQEEFYREVARIVTSREVDRIIGIGPELFRYQEMFPMKRVFYETTEDFLIQFPLSSFRDESILLKGARKFGFEQISQALQQKAHETILEINLQALVHNLNYFRAKLNPGVKIMAMVKAFSYGSGSFEIANLLQFHRADYLAVAYTDEGVELRKADITLPIMVMSPEDQSLDSLLAWNLEPEIYSLRILHMLEEAIERNYNSTQNIVRIHIKLDTGMHRLGFGPQDLDALIGIVKQNPRLHIQSIFSHLAASEAKGHDSFTTDQVNRFRKMSEAITRELDYPVLLHILNSAGISRFPEIQFDMVRSGIGLYGIGYNREEQKRLRNVTTLRTVIVQIKEVKRGETVGYNRAGKAGKDTTIAVVPVGYADGLNRKLGNRIGHMMVKGHPAPIIGNICMDLCMLDITEVLAAGKEVEEGDQVIVFGNQLPVSELAKILDTIPYEIMTGISRRVKRIYFYE